MKEQEYRKCLHLTILPVSSSSISFLAHVFPYGIVGLLLLVRYLSPMMAVLLSCSQRA